MESINVGELRWIINHVFLPPNLPNRFKKNENHEIAILTGILIASLREFAHVIADDNESVQAVNSAMHAVQNFASQRSNHSGDRQALLKKFLQSRKHSKAVIPIYVEAQNAGIIIQKGEDGVTFSMFEVSANNQSVTRTKGRQKRCFPASSVIVSRATFENAGFLDALISTIDKMTQTVSQANARYQASHSNLCPDTFDPILVTELLFNFLRANGGDTTIPGISKNTRDEVICNEDGRFVWRRSPVWLFLRVCLQLLLASAGVSGSEAKLYKIFMIWFMCRIIKRACEKKINSDMLLLMDAKIDRRNHKIGSTQLESWRGQLSETIRLTVDTLESRWATVIRGNNKKLHFSPFNISIEDDLSLQIPSLQNFLDDVKSSHSQPSQKIFAPESGLLKVCEDSLPARDGIKNSKMCQETNLAVFESWVSNNIDKYAASDPATCTELAELMSAYHAIAALTYKDNPEGISVMMLTTLELWVAIDRSTVSQYPLLLKYNPEVPRLVWSSLLLRRRRDMDRLHQAEIYLKNRGDGAEYHNRGSVFRSFGEENSFAVIYFGDSDHHQKLLAEIKAQEELEIISKAAELQGLIRKYQALMKAYKSLECDEEEVQDDSNLLYIQHSKNCTRCEKLELAKALTTTVYENSLPADALQSRSIVFELSPPLAFQAWREATVFLINNVLEMRVSGRVEKSGQKLSTYTPLQSYANNDNHLSRISLYSTKNSASRTVAITPELTIDDICVPHQPRWEYYDTQSCMLLEGFTETNHLVNVCTLKLSEDFEALKIFLSRQFEAPWSLNPNCVISRQSDCPCHLSIAEFKALCSLPLGNRVVWMNILTQLAMPSVDWKKTPTVLFTWQLSEQVGPQLEDSDIRETHQILNCPYFAKSLVYRLNESLTRLGNNWDSSRAVSAFTALANKLLCCGPLEVHQQCLEFMNRCRQICLAWTKTLEKEINRVSNYQERAIYTQKALETALICTDTFDLDDHYLEELLSKETNVTTLLWCSMVIQTNELAWDHGDTIKSVLISRWKRLLYRSLRQLVEETTTKKKAGLDVTIESVWAPYQASQPWTLVADCWLQSSTTPSGASHSVNVFFNLCTAEFLVNSAPVGKLPTQFVYHRDYATFFGKLSPRVVTVEENFEYSAGEYESYQLYISLRTDKRQCQNTTDLSIRAYRNGHSFLLLPPRIFQDKLPLEFVDKYVHWLDKSTGSVGFVYKATPWLIQSPHLRLVCEDNRLTLTRTDNDSVLVSYSSPIAGKILQILSPLETSKHIHLFYRLSTRVLELHLPRLQIDFYVEEGSKSIKSRQYRGKRIDNNQKIGTLIGLRNKLVLCTDEVAPSRIVLIPESRVVFRKDSYEGCEHVSVDVDLEKVSKVQMYNLHPNLERLDGSGSLQSELYVAYLHALTSYCLPDPFTTRTGTEHALSILSSCRVKSFTRLSSEDINTLQLIADLTPRRQSFPYREYRMQRVSWSEKLGILSQSGQFYQEVKRIFQDVEATGFLHETSFVTPLGLEDVNEFLLSRDLLRLPPGLQTKPEGGKDRVKHDAEYSARDRGQNSPSSRCAFAACFVLNKCNGGTSNDCYEKFVPAMTKILTSSYATKASKICLPSSTFEFDFRWLQHPKEIFTELWCQIHYTLGQNREFLSDHQLMIWVATIAFCKDSQPEIVQALLGMIANRGIAKLLPPLDQVYCLAEGMNPSLDRIRLLVNYHCVPFEKSPEASLPYSVETCRKRPTAVRRRLYRASLKHRVERVTTHLMELWHNLEPLTPPTDDVATYIDIHTLMTAIKIKFDIYKCNLKVLRYLSSLDDALSAVRTVDVPWSDCVLPALPHDPKIQNRAVSVRDIFHNCTPPDISDLEWDLPVSAGIESLLTEISPPSPQLRDLVTRLTNSAWSGHRRRYLQDLSQSILCLENQTQSYDFVGTPYTMEGLLKSQQNALKFNFDTIFQRISDVFKNGIVDPNSAKFSTWFIASSGTQWPRCSLNMLLRQLSFEQRKGLPPQWMQCISKLGRCLTLLQQCKRMLSVKDDTEELLKEMQTFVSHDWTAEVNPDYLLLEIEGNLRMRQCQELIAAKMSHPPGKASSVMQLNMGQGKSSVILPAIASTLADATALVRVIVPKPLMKQMREILVHKLGRLMGRRVYYLPISRAIKLDEKSARIIFEMCQDCAREGGVLLMQPEHVLSLQLKIDESFITERHDLVERLMDT